MLHTYVYVYIYMYIYIYIYVCIYIIYLYRRLLNLWVYREKRCKKKPRREKTGSANRSAIGAVWAVTTHTQGNATDFAIERFAPRAQKRVRAGSQ